MMNIMSNSQISDRMVPHMYSSIAKQPRQELYSSGIASWELRDWRRIQLAPRNPADLCCSSQAGDEENA